jgi:4-amino-4-deoxy-L-arabinose transferase-like glycosyltransferase
MVQSRKEAIFIILLVSLGALIRLWYFLEPFRYSVTFTPDEAVYGLQALHILKGEFSVFYWAQPYTGTFSAYLAALLFKFFGVAAVFLKLVPYVFSVGFLFLVYLLARAVFRDTHKAQVALFLAALGTPFWNNWSSRAGTGYPETNFLGVLLLLLGTGYLYGRAALPTNLLFLVLGFLAGWGFWVQPTIVYYLAPLLLFLFLQDRRFFLRPHFFLFVLGFIVGDLPVIYYNVLYPGVTSSSLFNFSFRGLKRAFLGLIFDGLPVVLGVRTSFSRTNFFDPLAVVVVFLFAAALLYALKKRWPDWQRVWSNFAKRSQPLDLILATFLSTLTIFLMTERFNQFVIEPRYIQALYATIPLLLANFVVEVKRIHPLWGWLSLGLLLANSLLGMGKAPPTSFVDPYRLESAIARLQERQIVYVNSEGALAHRLMFLTQESLIASVREGGLMAARYPFYNQAVLEAPWEHKGFLLRKSNPELSIRENEMRSFVPTYGKEIIDDTFVLLYPQ